MQKAPNFASLIHIRFAEFLQFIDVSIIPHPLPEVKHPNLPETGGGISGKEGTVCCRKSDL